VLFRPNTDLDSLGTHFNTLPVCTPHTVVRGNPDFETHTLSTSSRYTQNKYKPAFTIKKYKEMRNCMEDDQTARTLPTSTFT
jgi:hypothetical protein